jgi:hypothetical protein
MKDQTLEACLAACQACATACLHCAVSCLGEPDPAPMRRCIALDLDCADACRLTAAYLARDSAHLGDACELCAHLCRVCGDECGKHPMDHCQACAQACRVCAQACTALAGRGHL